MREFCRKSPLLSGLIVALLLFLLVYLAYGHYIGKIAEEVMVSAFDTYHFVENNPYADIISDEKYNKMVIRAINNYDIPNSYANIIWTHPFVIHWFTGANVWIKHDYYYYVGNDMRTGLTDVEIKFSFERQNGNWYITDCDLGTSRTGA